MKRMRTLLAALALVILGCTMARPAAALSDQQEIIDKALEAGTTTNLDADVYSFAKTSGLFGGLSLEGAGVLKRDSWNVAYYGTGATPYAILIQRRFSNPNAQPLRDALAPY